jgi:hypothetical protein
LLSLTGVFAAILLLSASMGGVSTLGYPLTACFLVAFLYLSAYRKGWIKDGFSLQGIVEGNLLFAGLVALFWRLV